MKTIYELRRERGVRAVDLADAIGVHFSTVYFWEMGNFAPRRRRLRQVADFFGVEPGEIITDREAVRAAYINRYSALPTNPKIP